MSSRPADLRLSEAERQHLQAVVALRRRSGTRVDAETCDRWRRRVRDGETPGAIARDPDVDWCQETIRRHVRGDCCSHDRPVDETPEVPR